MRTLVLIAVPMALLGGGFYFLVLRDRPPMYVPPSAQQPTTRRVVPTTLNTTQTQEGVVGSSAGVWVETLNKKPPYNRASRFRADRVDPRKDGAIDVTGVQAQFYSASGSVVAIDGTTGQVVVSQGGSSSDAQALGQSTPTEGQLQNVVIRFYEQTNADGDPVGEPTITVTVPAIRFNAIANRISTIDSVIDGKGVMAEQVPVTVRGRDFEFDGQGLTMNWNDREGRLDQLEINRGDRLLVKNLERFSGEKFTALPAPRHETAWRPSLTPRELLATALLGQIESSPATAPARAPSNLYHATFDRDVQIIRGGQELGVADVMRVVLPLGAEKKVETPANDRPRRQRRKPATVPATMPPTAPATATTKPEVPLEVRWTGKLTIRPAVLVEGSPRQQMVELVGAPARVEENGSKVEARVIHVEPDSGRLRVEPGGPVRTISVRGPDGAEIRSRSPLIVDRSRGIAEVAGGGTLVTPPAEGQTKPTSVSWSKRLEITLVDDGSGALKGIRVEGDAKVNSDSLNLECQTLKLGFDAPAETASPAKGGTDFSLPPPDLALLRVIEADGDARLATGAGNTARTLAGQKLTIGLVAHEKSAAITSLNCAGDVSLVDAKGLTINCGTLDVRTQPITLDPASQNANADPMASIESLIATQAVHLKQADGSSADGERLILAGSGAEKTMILHGAPARVSGERGSLQGDRIELDPKTGNVNVPGPGKFVGVDAKEPRNTMSIAWAQSMSADGNTGLCKLNGGVSIDGANITGTTLHATARRGELSFGVKPATPTTAPTTSPAAPAVAGVTLDSIRSLDLYDDVDVQMNAENVRSSSVQTQSIKIDLEAGVVSAPQAGRMLLVDQRPATTRPASNDVGPGTMALAWRDSLLWKLREGDLTLNGGVRAGFERAGSDDPIRITCESIQCGLTPVQTGKGVEQVAQKVELKTITAQKNVQVRSKQASFDSATLAYDALKNTATATGDEDTKVDVYDDKGASRVGFSAITWDIGTGQITDFRDIDGRIRR